MSDGLKSKALRGLFWSFSQIVGQQGIQAVVLIILARLLMPDEFGLIAMLTIFIVVAKSFVDSGFGEALIQKKDATYLDECSIFYFNISLGAAMAGLLCLAAPWIAAFYGRPVLTPLTRVLSLNVMISAFGIVQTARLAKRIDFKTQMKVGMTAVALSGPIGIIMAYQGFGVWSLVAQSLGSNLSRTALLWVFHRWRPAWTFSFASLRTMFPFGSKLLFSGLLDVVFSNLYLIVIGKMYSAANLGFYSRAKSLQQLPVSFLSASVGRVTFPIFSSVQDDKARLKRGIRKALATISMLNFPMMIGLAVVAKPLVLVLLTDKWLPCVPYLRLFCAAGLLYPLHAINLNVLKAQGRSDLFFRLEILKKSLVVIAVAITYRWGISAMICGGIATSCSSYYLNVYYTGKLLDYSVTEQIRDVFPCLMLASMMGGGVHLLDYVPFPNQLTLLVAQVAVGIALYVSLCHLFKLPSFVETMELAKPKLQILWRTS